MVVAHDLSPADVIAFKEHRFAAFITDVGGATSTPPSSPAAWRFPPGRPGKRRAVIRDGEAAHYRRHPRRGDRQPDRILEEYQLRKNQIELGGSSSSGSRRPSPQTIDGTEVQLQANIELPGDVPESLELGAEGIGLFRTEFLFLGRGDMPDEDEQFEAYRKVVKGMAGRPVTIRTFDLGGDKAIDA